MGYYLGMIAVAGAVCFFATTAAQPLHDADDATYYYNHDHGQPDEIGRTFQGASNRFYSRDALPLLHPSAVTTLRRARKPQMYHEKQSLYFCGLHALNNLLGGPFYSKKDLDEVSSELAIISDSSKYNFQSYFGLGYYDVSVLIMALQKRSYSAEYFDLRNDLRTSLFDKENTVGFILNVPVRSKVAFWTTTRHWVAIKREENLYYNLDSNLSHEQQMSQEQCLDFIFNAMQPRQSSAPDRNTLLIVTTSQEDSEI